MDTPCLLFYIFDFNFTSIIDVLKPWTCNVFHDFMMLICIFHGGEFPIAANCQAPETVVENKFRIGQ